MCKLRKLLVGLLLCTLPIQGLAAAITPIPKALAMLSALSATSVPCHEHGRAHNASNVPTAHAQPASIGADGDATQHSEAAAHLCCYQVFTCVPSSALRTASQKFTEVPHFALKLPTLFVPDSLYRPPRD
jgi:hypothetical protein